MDTKKIIAKSACTLMTVGSLNWGLVGAFQFNLVNELFGSIPALEKTIYLLVGLSGLVGLVMLFACKGYCDKSKK